MTKQVSRACFFSHLTDKLCGVAILFSSGFQPKVLRVNEVSLGSLLPVKVQFEDIVVNFISVYAPCVGAARVWFFQSHAEINAHLAW